jgi:hypothetical protein
MKFVFWPIILLLLIAVAIAAAVLYQNPDLLPWHPPSVNEQVAQEPSAELKPADSQRTPADKDNMRDADQNHKLELDYLEKLLAGVEHRQLEQLLDDEQAFQQFVRQEADNQSILAAARSNYLHEDKNVAFLMQRGADRVLRETYLNRLMLEQLPPDFPTREQAREFYEQNPDQFQISERIHVWQVFLQVEPGADEESVTAVEDQARDINRRLRAGELDIAKAAAEYSVHEPSRRNGGYMGMVRIADLKPEIARALGELETGAI